MTSRSVETLIVFLLAFLPAAYFYGPNLSNQNTRLDAIYAFVERDPTLPLFSIDRFLYRTDRYFNTNDKSLHEGHFYSNKPPGTIFIGIAIYSVLFVAEHIVLKLDVSSPALAYFNAYVINLFVSVLPFAISAVCFLWIFRQLKLESFLSRLLVLVYIFATPLIPYNTVMWGANTACSFIVVSLFLFLLDSPKPIWAGVSLGLAVASDYLAAISVASILIWHCFQVKRIPWRVALGVTPIIGAVLLYQFLCFGSPWKTSISDTAPAFLDSARFMGVFGFPSVEVLFKLLFSLQRGMLIMFPVFLFGLVGLIGWSKRKGKDPLLWLCSFNIISYLLIVSSFNGWHGGATVFPRYLIASIPFWILPMSFLLKRGAIAAIPLILFSAVNSLIIASVSSSAPDNDPNPLFGFAYGYFLKGELSIVKNPIRIQGLDPDFANYGVFSSSNIGMLAGLEGIYSLIPLLLSILLLLLLFFKMNSNDRQKAAVS